MKSSPGLTEKLAEVSGRLPRVSHQPIVFSTDSFTHHALPNLCGRGDRVEGEREQSDCFESLLLGNTARLAVFSMRLPSKELLIPQQIEGGERSQIVEFVMTH